ncbi:MAG: type II toxin-antitoxin system HigA family antitoxin [Armatimonadota bacterium]
MTKPKLIESEAEYEAALARVDALMSARAGRVHRDELELWVHLIEAYEDQRYHIPEPDPVEAIRFRMEQQNLKPVDLVPYLGSKSKVSEVLNGKRALSMTMVRRLHQGLGIPAESLLGEPGRRPSRLAARGARRVPSPADREAGRYRLRTDRPDPVVAEGPAEYGAPCDTRVAIQADPTISKKRKKWLLQCLALARKHPD